MSKIVDMGAGEARKFFLKGTSYFNADLPSYINFEPILEAVSGVLDGKDFNSFAQPKPGKSTGVNYNFIANKDGRFAWRPLELMHPAIYVSLVNIICEPDAWKMITDRFAEFADGAVRCCSSVFMSDGVEKDQAAQVREWWQTVEQASLKYSLDYTHILHTDVADCYGSLYTHSIPWALHGLEEAKASDGSLLGDKIDYFVRSGRRNQTNGISQGSVLMDFLAELVLGYVDSLITAKLVEESGFVILRYRDDYRIFTNSDQDGERILKVVSDCLREVGMRLGLTKTYSTNNVIEGSVKVDKIAAIELQDLGESNAETLQKQLLRLHSFGRKYPSSGALKRLLAKFHKKIAEVAIEAEDVEVQVAIATDIATNSPATFPVIAGILTNLLASQGKEIKSELWAKVRKKMGGVPYNGYQEVWLQRVTKPESIDLEFTSDEAICKIVDGEEVELWNNDWISSAELKSALKVGQIIVANAEHYPEVIAPSEVELFNDNAFAHSG